MKTLPLPPGALFAHLLALHLTRAEASGNAEAIEVPGVLTARPEPGGQERFTTQLLEHCESGLHRLRSKV